MMFKPIAPCKGCERRTMECHTVCERYIEFVKANEAYKAQNRIIQEREYDGGRRLYGRCKRAHK